MPAKEYIKVNGTYLQVGGPQFDVILAPGDVIAGLNQHLILTGTAQTITMPVGASVGDALCISTNDSIITQVITTGQPVNGGTDALIINRSWASVIFTFTPVGWRS